MSETTEQLDWKKAEEHLKTAERAYKSIGLSGSFAMAFVINPCRVLFDRGVRTQELYDKIMEISL